MPITSYHIEHSTDAAPAFELVPMTSNSGGLCPKKYRDKVVIDTIHDGHIIPERLIESPRVRPLVKSGELRKAFVLERDWGANLVAEHLVKALGLDGYHRVTTARVVMDFNRFPGNSSPDASPLDRMAVIKPFSTCLDYDEKQYILNEFYDTISRGMEAAIFGKLIKISIHTYDAYNPSRTERPDVSFITRSLSYQVNSKLPFGLFDPLFPDVLVESTCNSILRNRIGITLEKAGLMVEHNYPYCAADGSVEVRAQPWYYFHEIRSRFQEGFPEKTGTFAYNLIWNMLLNTNLRSGDSEALKGYLHRFQGPPDGREIDFDAARDAYESITRFVHSDPELTHNYRRSPFRASTFTIEVRKDLVFRFENGHPVEPREHIARVIAEIVADGITTYLSQDLEEIINGD